MDWKLQTDIRLVKFVISLKHFLLLFIKHAIKHLITKAFDLINTIPLMRTKALVNILLMSKFLWKSNLEHKLRVFEIVILNAKWKDCESRKSLRTKYFTYTNKFYVHEIAAENLSKIYFIKNAKKTCKPNNRDLNRDWKIE